MWSCICVDAFISIASVRGVNASFSPLGSKIWVLKFQDVYKKSNTLKLVMKFLLFPHFVSCFLYMVSVAWWVFIWVISHVFHFLVGTWRFGRTEYLWSRLTAYYCEVKNDNRVNSGKNNNCDKCVAAFVNKPNSSMLKL